MRTTLDLPDDLLDTAKSIARGRKQTAGLAVADPMRQALEQTASAGVDEVQISPLTGLPVIHLGVRNRRATDAYLAELARRRGARVVTLDKGFAGSQPDVVDLVSTA